MSLYEFYFDLPVEKKRMSKSLHFKPKLEDFLLSLDEKGQSTKFKPVTRNPNVTAIVIMVVG